MGPPPSKVGGARVILYSPIDQRHRPTGSCRHTVGGNPIEPPSGLVICQYDGEDSYYLFYCDSEWKSLADTWHQDLEDAQDQAEFEFEGVSSTWSSPLRQ
jgi:hypothetical protein